MRRLKAAQRDCYLLRYSDNQKKYLLLVLKRGLGQDRGNDLIKEFEILTINGEKCKINGASKSFRTLDELLSYYNTVPIHPSISSLGEICHSPRHKQNMTESLISQMSAAETLTRLKEQERESEKRIEELQRMVELNKSICAIL